MKEEAIKKINKIGKVSSALALIGKIVVGMALALLLVVTVMCFFAPKELLTVDVAERLELRWDVSSLGSDLSDEELKELKKELEEHVIVNDEMVTEQGVVVTEDDVQVDGEVSTYSFTLRDLAWLMVVLCVNVIMIMVTLCFVSALCKAFRDCESPFEKNVVKKMSNIAYALIPWALISSVTNSISDSIMQNKVSLNLTVDLGVIMIVFVVFILVHIFKYGAMLQQESDETL